MAPVDPKETIIQLFENNDVVLLGESHGIANNLELICEILPHLAAAGVYNIALEFSAEEFQNEVDVLLASPRFDSQRVREMLFAYNVGWPYVEYQMVHKAVWAFNQSNNPKMRLVHPSYIYDWSQWQGGRSRELMKGVFHRGDYNEFRANTISKALQGGGKLLGLFGAVHAFRDSRNLELFSLEKHFLSLGMLLDLNPNLSVASAKFNFDFPGFWDADLRSPNDLRPCSIDREFLKNQDLNAVTSNWPDPDWTPAPSTVEQYWEIIHSR